jgi:hypothetical protein
MEEMVFIHGEKIKAGSRLNEPIGDMVFWKNRAMGSTCQMRGEWK